MVNYDGAQGFVILHLGAGMPNVSEVPSFEFFYFIQIHDTHLL